MTDFEFSDKDLENLPNTYRKDYLTSLSRQTEKEYQLFKKGFLLGQTYEAPHGRPRNYGEDYLRELFENLRV